MKSILIVLILNTSFAAYFSDPGSASLIMGVMKFKNSKIWGNMPTAGRLDVELANSLALVSRINYLKDENATYNNFYRKLRQRLRQMNNKSQLMIYYTGHGDELRNDVAFGPHDANYDEGKIIKVRTMLKFIRRHYQGGKILFLIDTCFSGGIVNELKKPQYQSMAIAAISSTRQRALSVGEWGFTDYIIQAIRGNKKIDFNKNREIDFRELAGYIRTQMALSHEQLSNSFFSQKFNAKTIVAKVDETQLHNDAYVTSVFTEGSLWDAEVLYVKGKKALVSYYGNDFYDYGEVVDLSIIRPDLFLKNPKVGEYIVFDFPEYKLKNTRGRIVKTALGVYLVEFLMDNRPQRYWISKSQLKLK